MDHHLDLGLGREVNQRHRGVQIVSWKVSLGWFGVVDGCRADIEVDVVEGSIVSVCGGIQLVVDVSI